MTPQPDADLPTTATPPVTDVVRGLNLPPETLRLAHWRKLASLPTPEAAPFDQAAACDRLLKARTVEYSGSDWGSVGLRWGMSSREAAFWVATAGRWCKGNETAQQVVAHARKQTLPDAPDEAWVRAQFPADGQRQRELPAELAAALATILGPARLLDTLADGMFTGGATGANSWHLRHDLPVYRGFWEHVLPYLDSATLDPVRDALRPKLDPSTWPKTGYDGSPRPFFVAAILGLSEPIEDVVRAWPVLGPKDTYVPWAITSNQPLLVLFGLSDPARIESVARNLRLPFGTPFDLRGWLANTGTSGLDFAAKGLSAKDSFWKGALSAELCRVPDPAAAPHVLGLKVNGQYPAIARQWLTRNVGSAVAGLLGTAVGRGRVAEAAGEYLRDLTKIGFGGVVERELAHVAPEVAARVRRTVLQKPERATETLAPGSEPEWLADALRAGSDSDARSPLPEWLNPATLPPILIDGRRLPDETVTLMLRQVRDAAADDAPALAAALADGADAGACDRFAAALFERWVAEKNNAADVWVLNAAAVLGGDATVAVLVSRLKRWPGGAPHKRLREGLKAVRRIGTPYALAQVAALATGGGNYRLRGYATEELKEAATRRGLSTEQLEDRTLPALGLDDPASAEATLDFGPRQFRAVVAPDLRLLARDDHGKTFLVLPTPRKTDDKVKVAEARAAWKLAKKQFDLVVGGACKRMEHALVTQRRWGFEEFAEHLVRHPITGAVVRRLLWGLFDPTTTQPAAFRVSAEGEFVDADDRPLPPPPEGGTVGILHPVQLTPAGRELWAERLSDYEIIPPFPQLARPVIDLTAEEREATEFTRFSRKDLQRYHVEALPAFGGWTREYPNFSRRFPHLGLKAVVKATGYNPMELAGVSFRSDAPVPRNGQPEPPRALGTVDPVVLCECLADVRAWVPPGA